MCGPTYAQAPAFHIGAPVQLLLLVEPVATVVELSGHLPQSGVGAEPFPPGEKVPMGHAEQFAPPKPGAHTVVVECGVWEAN